MNIKIRQMEIADHGQAYELWRRSEGVGLVRADGEEDIARFLKRNEGMSFVAVDGGEIVGTILCGQDGRRGHLYHLAVKAGYKRRGIAKRLVSKAIEALEKDGFDSCHLMVFPSNKIAMAFWEKLGFERFELANYIYGDVRKQLEEFKKMEL